MRQQLKGLVNRFLKSERRMCPVCASPFAFYFSLPAHYPKSWKQFGFPYGADDFETLNATEFSCPVCGCTDRDRLFALYLKKEFTSKTDLAVLDIAPSQNLSGWIRQNLSAKYITADLFMPGVDLKLDIGDMHQINAQTFDLVICSHVLEHVPDDIKALSEIFRVLKKGGQAILMVPILKSLKSILEDPSEEIIANRWRRFGQDDHIRLYSKQGWEDRIRHVGFSLQTLTALQIHAQPHKFGIDPASVLYIAHRQP